MAPMAEELLVPPPHRVRRRPGHLDLDTGLVVERTGEGATRIQAALDRLRVALQARGADLTRAGRPLRLEARVGYPAAQGYRLEVDPDGILIVGRDGVGLSHGLSTLAQWVRIHTTSKKRGTGLSSVSIVDAPAIPVRAVMFDISRSRVPTMSRLRQTIEQLAGWKCNQLELYIEHTFAYEGHEEVWARASPLTPVEARELDTYCAERHIELVPNQNSFGHLHRWLVLPRYRGLAECPEGIAHPFSEHREPFSLCPTDPGSLELLDDLFGQLLANFESGYLHIGFDETIELGKGRSRERAAQVGVAGLYAEFLGSVHGLAARRGRRIQLWGDIVARHPELLERIPPDAVLVDWGYEADHPFQERAAAIAAAGLEYHLCPGTSSWLSLAGRLSNATDNIAAAVRAAIDHRAGGVMIADWGDQGHLQPPVVSLPGLMTSAAFCWNPGAIDGWSTQFLARLLDVHAFGASPGEGAARTLLEMSQLYDLPGASTFNGSPLFHLLVRPDWRLDHRRMRGLDRDGLEQCSSVLESLTDDLETLPGRDIAWVRRAMTLATRIGLERLDHGLADSAAELPAGRRAELAAELGELIHAHGELWRESSRPGGYEESRAVLERAHTVLAPPSAPGQQY